MPLRRLLGPAGQKLGLHAAVETGRIWARWAVIVGPEIAAHAQPTSLRDGILRVKADSPVWATEIGYLSSEIKKRANSVVDREVVREVRVWSGPLDPPAPPRPRSRPRPEAAVDAPPPSAPAPAVDPGAADPKEALGRAFRAWSKRRSRRGRDAFTDRRGGP